MKRSISSSSCIINNGVCLYYRRTATWYNKVYSLHNAIAIDVSRLVSRDLQAEQRYATARAMHSYLEATVSEHSQAPSYNNTAIDRAEFDMLWRAVLGSTRIRRRYGALGVGLQCTSRNMTANGLIHQRKHDYMLRIRRRNGLFSPRWRSSRLLFQTERAPSTISHHAHILLMCSNFLGAVNCHIIVETIVVRTRTVFSFCGRFLTLWRLLLPCG